MEGETFSISGGAVGNGRAIDGKMVQTFQKKLVEVEKILDQNRLLINEINQNQESKMADNLGRNVGLIRELNNNIRRVVDLYADLTKSMEPDAKPGYKRNRPPPSPP
ncbi:protein ELF4-LIKE 3-like isoform X2 [Momordica charantia]|uniref:Protein ELF4-LIKE 3-like isoform X2 n=1 Tax=Momordica charantia TaxID=3673 RepID=A0A6J1DK73_MOMCH|nr:protein ELF4-LIKE 3-like isoform X2 [Momordica charantia]XP_022154646.1 protein ELF4-LIKE 3-like isoform X2 [Momordica charantia]XP_022154647.1 protein ELF4-LIKE 3-like isoform X2 [Momordica charantia]